MQVYRNVLAARERLGRVGPYLRPGGSLLDIGSGSGEFLYLVGKAGYLARGLEPDEGYSAYVREAFGLDVESRPLGAPPPAGSPFDAITIFHVLEHLENPREAMATLASWLRPGGVLVVEVPNIESRCTAPHHRFHRAHLYHFNRETLSAMGERSGMKVLDCIMAPDLGTITIVFADVPPERRMDLWNNPARVRRALEGYTNLRHYLGGTLLRQQVRKLGQNIRGRWVCRGLRTPAGVLERM
jgi:SAM-dependent methyltransferase